jgi:hypothetical protein
VELHLGNHTARRRPTGCTIEKPLYHTTGLYAGRPTARVRDSTVVIDH